MSNRIQFTDARIKALPAPTEGRATYHDKEPGLCVRITPNGHKAFYVVGRFKVDGGLKSVVKFSRLGDFPSMGATDARKAALARRKELGEGKDPVQEKRQAAGAPTLGDLWTEYRTRHLVANGKGTDQADWTWGKDLAPLARRKLADLRPRDVVVLVNAVKDRGAPQGAVKVRSMLRSMFQFGMDQALCEFNPVVGTGLPAKKSKRERVLGKPNAQGGLDAPEEIPAFWNGLEAAAMTLPVRQALRVVLATGQRPGEVAGMAWDELDLKAGTWTIPAARQKSRREHSIPLPALALEIIASMPQSAEHVFPGMHAGQPIDAKTLPKVLRRERLAGRFPGVDQFTPHDLRRTMATLVRSARITRAMVDLFLGHAVEGVMGHYDHSAGWEEKQRVAKAWDRRLRDLLNPPASNVVPLKRRAAK